MYVKSSLERDNILRLDTMSPVSSVVLISGGTALKVYSRSIIYLCNCYCSLELR